MKKPWLAAALNLVPLGLGYWYLGAWTKFLRTLLLGIAAPFMGVIIGPVIVDGVSASIASECGAVFSPACPRPWWAYVLMILGLALPSLLIAGLTARGAHRRALARNVTIAGGE